MSDLPIYLFDLDGTVFDQKKRERFLDGKEKHWLGFFLACGEDPVSPAMAELIRTLSQVGEIWFLTNRPQFVMRHTREAILNKVLMKAKPLVPYKLVMRGDKDTRGETEFREEFLQNLPPETIDRIRLVFDDRESNHHLYTEYGLNACLVRNLASIGEKKK